MWTYRHFGLTGSARVQDVKRVRLDARRGDLILAAYAVNELPEAARDALLPRLLDAHRSGAGILVIEPIGRRVNLWWTKWAADFLAVGGREDDWRFRTPLPARQRTMAKGAGLDVQELTARSLFVPGAHEALHSVADH